MNADELIDILGAENAIDIHLSYHDKNTVEIKNDLLDWMGAEITDAQAEELATAIVKYLMETNAKPEAVTGRPTYYDKPMIQTAVYLTPEMIAWLKSQGGMGEVVRGLIDQAMKAGDKNGK